jgi:hypothetical protein
VNENVPPLVVRSRPWYTGRKVMLTVTDEGLESPACGLIPWASIRSLPAVNGAYGRRLEVDVFDQADYVARMSSPLARLLARVNLLFGWPLLGLTDQVIGMTPEELRAEIELRAGRTFPH